MLSTSSAVCGLLRFGDVACLKVGGPKMTRRPSPSKLHSDGELCALSSVHLTCIAAPSTHMGGSSPS
jgi:hypothetical protein